MANEQIADQGVRLAQAGANQPPEAGDVWVGPAASAAIEVPILANVSDPDRDPLQVISASEPASGEVDAEPGGTLRFDPVQPGVQRFRYQVADGRGGIDAR
jgi:hypothetical protein